VGAEIWRIRDGARVAGPLVTGVACTSGAFNADCSLLATSHSDGTVQVWRMPDAVALNTLRIGRDGFGARYLTFFPDGDRLLIHNHGRVSVWSTNTGAMLYELQVAKIEMVALSPDGNHIAVATRTAGDGISIAVWDANTGGIRGEVRGPARLGMIAFTSDSRGLGAIDPTGETWAYRVSDLIQMPIDNLSFAATSAQESRLYGPSPKPRWLAVDGATLAVSTVHGVKLVSFSGKAGTTHILPAGIKPYVALHQQRGLVATVDGNGVVRAWSLSTAEPVTPQYAHGGRRGFIGLTTDADHLILSEGAMDSAIHALTADGRPIADIARSNRMLLSHELINGSMIAPVEVDTLRTLWMQHAADRRPLTR
jgi:WD40 repeat protein